MALISLGWSWSGLTFAQRMMQGKQTIASCFAGLGWALLTFLYVLGRFLTFLDVSGRFAMLWDILQHFATLYDVSERFVTFCFGTF